VWVIQSSQLLGVLVHQFGANVLLGMIGFHSRRLELMLELHELRLSSVWRIGVSLLLLSGAGLAGTFPGLFDYQKNVIITALRDV